MTIVSKFFKTAKNILFYGMESHDFEGWMQTENDFIASVNFETTQENIFNKIVSKIKEDLLRSE